MANMTHHPTDEGTERHNCKCCGGSVTQHPTDLINAPHIEGGNFYNDMRIDISGAHKRLDNFISPSQNIDVARAKMLNIVRLYFTRLCIKLGIHEALVFNGIRKKWFDDFKEYWLDVLGGRPIYTADFLALLHEYRTRQQHTSVLEWNEDPSQHLANWQDPSELYSTFNNVRKIAVHPVVGLRLWKRIPKGSRVLEYGCSLAPYYSCYREFFTHLKCHWVLADIPNFPFHYARYLFRNDSDVEFVTINADDFADPLRGSEQYDVIVLTTVFEHLDDPLFVSQYLLDRLTPGGLFVFDYIKSHAHGLDHPNALKMREVTLQSILNDVQILYGDVNDLSKSIGLCIARKT